MNQIRFDCPGCGQTIEMAEEARFERVKCPTCQHEFFPDKTRPVRLMPTAPAAPPPNIPLPRKPELVTIEETFARTEAEKIHSKADFFTVMSLLFLVGSLLVAFVCILSGIAGVDVSSGFIIVVASLIGVSLWFYLIAQIVHIRANTEK